MVTLNPGLIIFLFIRTVGTKMAILLVYVDDLLIIRNDIVLFNELKDELHQCFQMKDLDGLK